VLGADRQPAIEPRRTAAVRAAQPEVPAQRREGIVLMAPRTPSREPTLSELLNALTTQRSPPPPKYNTAQVVFSFIWLATFVATVVSLCGWTGLVIIAALNITSSIIMHLLRSPS
jgi:hypothetical protein